VTDGRSVQAFRDMITTVRDRVQRMIKAGRTASEVRDAHPSSEFDAQWGHGRVTADEFVQEIYAALRK
jgi:cyclase